MATFHKFQSDKFLAGFEHQLLREPSPVPQPPRSHPLRKKRRSLHIPSNLSRAHQNPFVDELERDDDDEDFFFSHSKLKIQVLSFEFLVLAFIRTSPARSKIFPIRSLFAKFAN